MACIAKCNEEKYMRILYQTPLFVCVWLFSRATMENKSNMRQRYFTFQAVDLTFSNFPSKKKKSDSRFTHINPT